MIRIGTCVKGNEFLSVLPWVVENGFETVEMYFNDTLGGIDFYEVSQKAEEIIGESKVKITSIGLYCNPLQYENQRKELEYCIENAHLFGADIVSTFAGALPGLSVDKTIPEFKRVFSELTKAAENSNVRIGIENAHMYGHWYAPSCNIGFCPRAWEMLFDVVNSDNLGLEWEPSHQLEQLGDPLSQLKKWLPKIVHVHGKDAVIDREHIKMYGAWFGESYCVHRFPGFGECDWREIIQILSDYGYESDICIEGFHDPVYCGEREYEGQLAALSYLRKCREGECLSLMNIEPQGKEEQ